MKEKTKDSWRSVALGSAAALALMAAMCSVMMLKTLLSSWLIPVLCVLPVALCLSLPFRGVTRWLTRSRKTWVNVTVHTLLVYPVLLSAVLTANRIWTLENRQEMHGVVNRVYTEMRRSSRRVSRRSYRTVETPHNVIDVTLDNGSQRKIDVTRKIYSRASKGDTVDIPVTTGIFHLVQMDESHLKLRHTRHSSRSPRL